MKFKNYIENFQIKERSSLEIFENCNNIIQTNISEEYFINLSNLLLEIVLQVHHDIEKIIKAIEAIKEPSIENITKVLKSFDILFVEKLSQRFPLEATTVGYDDRDYQIILYYKNINDNIINKSKIHFHDLANRIGVILAHEFVHLSQYKEITSNMKNDEKVRKFLERTSSAKIEDKKVYLSHPREIMAFAAMIYQELIKSGLNNKDIKNLFVYNEVGQNSMRIIAQNSPAALEYFQLFKTDEKVMKKLFKNLYGYIIGNTNYFKGE